MLSRWRENTTIATALASVRATVVIPCRNGGALLEACLAAVSAQSVRTSLHVIVVDNGSQDRSLQLAREHADEVFSTSVPGPSGPRNRGLQEVSTEFFLSLDADCIPADDWAERHLAAISAAPSEVLGIAGRSLPLVGSGRWARRPEITPHPDFVDGHCQYAVAGNACYRTNLLREAGGFPNRSADDAALGMVARDLGLSFVYEPTAVVMHRNPEGITGYAKQARKIGRYTAELHPNEPYTVIVRSRARMLAGAFRLLVRGELEEAAATAIRAVAGALGWLDARRFARSTRA